MPTNPQRYGTMNMPLNLPKDYIAKLGKASFARMERSRTAFAIKLMELGAAVVDPALAKDVREIRRQFYATAMLVIVTLSMGSHDCLRRAMHRTVVHVTHAAPKGRHQDDAAPVS